MKRFALLGRTLTHSFSQKYFTSKFESSGLKDHVFELFEIAQIEDFRKILSEKSPLSGMNVTIPYKEQIIPYLDSLDTNAESVGAVNVIKFTKEGKLVGYNSDYFGFKNSLLKTLNAYLLINPKHALILGTGGASKAVAAALKDMGIKYKFVSRELGKGDIIYKNLDKNTIQDATLIINASPLGTFPNINQFPDIPYEYLTQNHLLFDLVYNPEDTAFMKKGRAYGAKTKNGLEMLHLQAEKAWEIWNS